MSPHALSYNLPMGYPRGEFGDRLRYYRERAGLTQAALARALATHEMTVVKWEGGSRKLPNAENLQRLAQVLHVSMGQLLGAPYAETEPAVDDYLASPYARQLADEGVPVGAVPGELDFLRYQIESTWREGRPSPKVLHQFLLAFRAAPDLQRMFAPPEKATDVDP